MSKIPQMLSHKEQYEADQSSDPFFSVDEAFG